jgi:endonuclease/exonuclease/phosphatase family metal-dependent hydrolase
VRLATFNLLHGRSLTDGRVVPERLAEAARALDADVLGLQEVDRGQARSGGADQTEQVARATGAEHWRFVPAITGTPGGTWRAATDGIDDGQPAYGWPGLPLAGVVLAGRPAPAARVRRPVLLPGTRRIIWLQDEPRVGVVAVVETPRGPVTVGTTHLSFVPGRNGAQLRTLTAAMARLPGPHVLLGDFNLPGPLPRLLTRWRPLARTPTYPAPEPRVQLDHVLASGELPPVTSVQALPLPVSDHRALVVQLRG